MIEPKIPGAEELRTLVAEIAATYMPFGKYGIKAYPPKGCPLYDLPLEYLEWFRLRGFPKGKLGMLMEQCLLLKSNGFDRLFDPFRRILGGRSSAKKRHGIYKFPE